MSSLGEREMGGGNFAMAQSDRRFFGNLPREVWFLVTRARVIAQTAGRQRVCEVDVPRAS
jgi:hypothetical protein